MIVRIRGVKRVRAKGRLYYYHRATNARIKAEYGTPEFVLEVQRLNAKELPKSDDNTLGSLIAAYKQGEHFKRLAPTTRSDYDRVLESIKFTHKLVAADITTGDLVKLRDRLKAGTRRKNYAIQVLSAVFSWGQLRDWVRANPAKGIPALKGGDGSRPWTAYELKTVLETCPNHLRLPILLGAYAGLRQGDVLTLPWSAYDGVNIAVRQRKTRREVVIPVHVLLRDSLDEAAKHKRGTVMVVGEKGRPYTGNGFRAVFYRHLRKIRKEGKVEAGLRFHGLRHTLGTALAEAGANTRTIAAVLGHATEAMSAHYSRRAEVGEQARAAMKRMEQK